MPRSFYRTLTYVAQAMPLFQDTVLLSVVQSGKSIAHKKMIFYSSSIIYTGRKFLGSLLFVEASGVVKFNFWIIEHEEIYTWCEQTPML